MVCPRTKAASPCTGAAVVVPHARSALQPLGEVCPRHRGLAVSRLRRSLVVAGPVDRSLPSSRSVLPCARRSSPLVAASGMAARPSRRTAAVGCAAAASAPRRRQRQRRG